MLFFKKDMTEETKRKIGDANRISMKRFYDNGGVPWNKGKPRTEEVKLKISVAHKGKKFSEEHKQKISEAHKGEKNSFYGKKHSPEAIEKIRQDNYNNPRRYWLGKKRLEMTGEKHPRWKGGMRKRKDERNDSLYQYWVGQVKKRDGKCMMSNEECDGYLIVHHILSWHSFLSLRYEIDNGITLCQFHHPRKWSDEEKLIPTFRKLVRNSSC